MPAAKLDMRDAHDGYEREGPGLGARLRRFPYGLFFRKHGDGVFVIACFHSSRDPLIWLRRV